MANQSIYAAFERMWGYILEKINDHSHDVEHGGTGYDSIVDTEYTTARYRASALVSTETTPDGNGIINWMYE